MYARAYPLIQCLGAEIQSSACFSPSVLRLYLSTDADALDKNGQNTRRNAFLSAERVLAAGPGGAPQPLAPAPRAQLVRPALGKTRSHAPLSSHKGHRGKKIMEVTYIFCSPKKQEVTYFIFILFLIDFLSRFWAFRNKSSSKHGGGGDKKIHLGSSQITKKCGGFFLRFFFSRGCFARFFYRGLGVS
jgi:hypothetical protein